jgi:transposase-like protein
MPNINAGPAEHQTGLQALHTGYQRDRVGQRQATRAVRARGHFPTEQAALKCLYMTLMGLDPTGRGRGRWTMRWKAALNAFDVAFEGRLSAGRNQPRIQLHR